MKNVWREQLKKWDCKHLFIFSSWLVYCLCTLRSVKEQMNCPDIPAHPDPGQRMKGFLVPCCCVQNIGSDYLVKWGSTTSTRSDIRKTFLVSVLHQSTKEDGKSSLLAAEAQENRVKQETPMKKMKNRQHNLAIQWADDWKWLTSSNNWQVIFKWKNLPITCQCYEMVIVLFASTRW